MKKYLLTIFAVGGVAFCAMAAENIDKKMTEKEALAEKMLEVSEVAGQMKMAMDGVADSMLASMISDPNELAEAQKMFNELKPILEKNFGYEALKPHFIRIYAETFTDGELKGLIEFYQSDLGKALLKKTPELTAKSMQIMQMQMPKLMADMQQFIIQKQQEAAAKQEEMKQ